MAILMRCNETDEGASLIHADGFDAYYRVAYVGQVISLGERNGYHDSDFYAVVWNPEKGWTETVVYASTRGPSGAANAWIDATPEVVAAVDAYHLAAAARRAALAREAAAKAADKAANVDAEFARVQALKGAQVRAKKAAGTLFWIGRSGSGKSVRVGVKDADGNVTWADSKTVQAA